MTNETIFLGGAPTVGFGEPSPVHLPNFGDNYAIPVGALVGAAGGATLGHLVRKGTGTAVGAVVGGVFGALMGWGSSGL